MAGLLNNILDYIRVNDEDDYDDYDEMDSVKEEPVVRSSRRSEAAEPKASRRNRFQEADEEEQESTMRRERAARTERGSSKVVPMRTLTKGLEVCVVRPSSFADSQQICNELLGGRACVLNLEGFDEDNAQRIIDFVSGCLFSIDGKIHRISRYIFILAPNSVDISGDYLELLPSEKNSSVTINKEL